MKKLTTVVVACLASFFLSQNTFADATGDTYSFSMTAFDSAGSGSFVIPVTDIVFGSGPHAVAPSCSEMQATR